MGAFETMAHDCIELLPEFEAITDAEKPLQSEKFLKANPTKTEPWRSVMLRNTPGQAPAGAPVLIAQGTADTTVRPGITKQFGEHLCKQGARLDLIWLKGVSHTFAAQDSADRRCPGSATASEARQPRRAAGSGVRDHASS